MIAKNYVMKNSIFGQNMVELDWTNLILVGFKKQKNQYQVSSNFAQFSKWKNKEIAKIIHL